VFPDLFIRSNPLVMTCISPSQYLRQVVKVFSVQYSSPCSLSGKELSIRDGRGSPQPGTSGENIEHIITTTAEGRDSTEESVVPLGEASLDAHSTHFDSGCH
jgi:hypothetical protein